MHMMRLKLIDYFDKGATRDPDHVFLVEGDVRKSYQEVQASSYRIARLLMSIGASRGTHVAVYSPNSARALEAILGILRAGSTWVSLNVHNALDDTCQFINNNDIEVVFIDPAVGQNLDYMRERCPGLRTVLSLGAGTLYSPSYDELIGPHSADPVEVEVNEEDIATILSSGGTTGVPKGVQLSHRAWSTMICGTSDIYRGDQHVMLLVAPITHASGTIALGMMQKGTTNVVLPGFDPTAVMRAIEDHRVTHLFLPPAAIYALLDHPDVRSYDYSSLDHIICASTPIAVSRIEEIVDVFGPVFSQAYGQNETMTTVAYFSPGDHVAALRDPALRHRLFSVGKACLVSRIAVMDGDGALLGPGEMGEIVVRGGMLSSGYYKRPDSVAELSRFGWHHTSDIGYLDKDGYLYIAGRTQDMIVSGDLSIFANEVEQVLMTHPAVFDCAVVGIADGQGNEVVTAVVELKAGASIEPRELEMLCQNRLPTEKAPKSFHVWPALPRSSVGKILKRKIKERF
jgi:acyl-CoA synthetase (AMP-forming)/AMP-acid ligase II